MLNFRTIGPRASGNGSVSEAIVYATPWGAAENWFVAARRAVLCVDMVESVRLIEADEAGIITAWRQIVDFTEARLDSASRGRKVKSTGDGMLLELETVPVAVALAFEIADEVARRNEGVPEEQQIHVRLGLEVGEFLVDERDIYGHRVNLAARLAALGHAGDLIGSADVRDEIVDGIDADVEDMGECFLKHVREPVRAYHFRRPGTFRRMLMSAATQPLTPTLAVIPLAGPEGSPAGALGQVLAEELIRAFGRSPNLSVISRLSTQSFARGAFELADIGQHLNASHVVSGSVLEVGDKLRVALELTEVRSGHVIWDEVFHDRSSHVLIGEQQLIARIAEAVGRTIMNRELQRARSLPVRTLESYTLMLGAVNAMYRLSRSDFMNAEAMLQAVIERNPRHSVPLAWLGNWHVLKVQQGWTEDAQTERRFAEGHTARALDLNPDCEHALTIDGLVQTNLSKNFEEAEDRYGKALEVNPNSPLANLLKGTMHAFRDEGQIAVDLTQRAIARSPFDPQAYYYYCLASVSFIAADDPKNALVYAKRSLAANSTHTSTLRTLATAQWLVGDEEAARETVRKLTALEPSLTVSKWRETNPAAKYRIGQLTARVLRDAGLPE